MKLQYYLRLYFSITLFIILFPSVYGIPITSEESLQELTIAFSKQPYTINFIKEFNHTELLIHSAIYSGLLTPNPTTLQPEVGLAISWFINEAQDTYIFNLRKNAQFSNGTPITTMDVKASWIAAIQENNAFIYLFELIKGVSEYSKKTKSLEDIGIEVVNDRVLKVTLKSPSPQFLSTITHPAFSVTSRAQIQKTDWDKDILGIDFTGPFVVSAQSQEKLELTKNKYFWGNQFVNYEKITILFFESDKQSEIIQIINEGSVQWSTFYEKSTESLEDEDWLIVHPIFGSQYLFFGDTQSEPWNNADVRTAIRLLLPLDKILKKKYTFPASSLVPPISGSYDPSFAISEQDSEKALSLLKDAGYPKGQGLGLLTLLAPEYTDGTYDDIFDTIAEKLSLTLTDPVEIKTLPVTSYYDDLPNHEFSIGVTSWIGDFIDPTAFLQIWNAPNQALGHNYNNKEYQDALIKSYQEDSSDRNKFLAEAEKILLDTTVIIPLHYLYVANIVRTDLLKGWDSNLLDIHPFGALYRKQIDKIPNLTFLPFLYNKK